MTLLELIEKTFSLLYPILEVIQFKVIKKCLAREASDLQAF